MAERTMTQNSNDEACDYCGRSELAYEMRSDRGMVTRCIPCLAIEQLQQKFSMPFEVWIDRDDIKPTDHPDDPLEESFDPREHDYKTVRAWSTVLARIVEDDPLVKRDPDSIGTIFEDTREFLTNIMGSDAHHPPSEVAGADIAVGQTTFEEAEE